MTGDDTANSCSTSATKDDASTHGMDASSSVSGDERAKDGKSKIKNTVTNFNKDTPDSIRTTHDSPTAINDSANHASSKFIVKTLKELYHSHVVEAEKRYHLHFNFCLPTDGEIKDSEFDATPMVLLIGQYSTGKVRLFSYSISSWTFSSRVAHLFAYKSMIMI